MKRQYKDEHEFTADWTAWVKAAGARVFACVASMMQEPGWPDRRVSHHKFSFWCESKREDNPCSPKQRMVFEDLRWRKDPIIVARWCSRVGVTFETARGDLCGTLSEDELRACATDQQRGHLFVDAAKAAWAGVLELYSHS